MAADRRPRRAGTGRRVALATAALLLTAGLGACGEDIPPLPEEFRRLEQQETGCIACHDGRNQPSLDPGTTATPGGHPPTAILRRIESHERARLAAGD